jgi:hypothetical protein
MFDLRMDDLLAEPRVSAAPTALVIVMDGIPSPPGLG